MIVDDEPGMLMMLQAAVGAANSWRTDTAATAEDAQALLRAHPYDLLVTDKNLPGMDGVELIRWVREAIGTLPCVLITGFGSVGSATESLELGINAYIEKPFSHIDTVIERLRDIIDRQSRRSPTPSAARSAHQPAPATRVASLPRTALIVSPLRGETLTEYFAGMFTETTRVADGNEARAEIIGRSLGVVVVDAALGWPEVFDLIRLANDGAPRPASAIIGVKSAGLEELKRLIDLGVGTLAPWPVDAAALRSKVEFAMTSAALRL